VPSGAIARYRWVTSEPGRYLITAKATDSNGAVASTAAITIDVPDLPTKVSQKKWSYEYDAIGKATNSPTMRSTE
jgi:hypothetical protein